MANNSILLLAMATAPIILLIWSPWLHPSNGVPLPVYMTSRDELLAKERGQRVGGRLVLSEKEQKVNLMLMAMKDEEYEAGLSGEPFPPAMHFMLAKHLIDKSEVFDVIKMMPKGAALHVHDSALAPLPWVISELTYLPDLYYCTAIPDRPDKFAGLRFSYFAQPPSDPMVNCTEWKSVASERKRTGNATLFDEWLFHNISMLTADPHSAYPDTYKAWEKFRPCLTSVGDLMYGTVEAFTKYINKALNEFYEDNVQYMEIRYLGPLMKLNSNLGSPDPDFTIRKYIELVENFNASHPDFFGAKFISQSIRIVEESSVQEDIKRGIQNRKKYPDYYAGHDLVSEEDLGFPLLHYIKELLIPSQKNKSLPFFFHAGETDWQGTFVDENLFDAILLNTTRIGHGYAITKHPVAMEMAKQKGIAIEVNPISNQVLGLVSDPRNHPATTLMAYDMPMVISSDDPAVWNAKPASHDYYQAFMGLSGKTGDLTTLKQLVINSIRYSALTDAEERRLMKLWTLKWDAFLDQVIAKYGDRYIRQV